MRALASRGKVWRCGVGLGMVLRSPARLSMVMPGTAGTGDARRGKVVCGKVGSGTAKLGLAMQGMEL